ncbi:hypothetical protein [Erythrobacter sp. MTPC3]|uniref:hypothetical protein n=1 Tax=Erythrobacter sp. MTPC3 TaxID=3056564 RepID=UPI0036F3557A
MPNSFLKISNRFAFGAFACVSAGLLAPAAPAAASCNPDDCGKGSLSAAELARDKAEIKRLNREQLRYVQRRDAEYAKGWDATRRHKSEMSQYAREQADYERRMAQWREAVRRCRDGDYRYCAR